MAAQDSAEAVKELTYTLRHLYHPGKQAAATHPLLLCPARYPLSATAVCLAGDMIHVFHIILSVKRFSLLKKGREPAPNDVSLSCQAI